MVKLNNNKIWDIAKKVIPSGNCFLSKNPIKHPSTKWPKYFSKAKGCEIWDIQGKKFYDFFLMGVGTNVLGYADSEIDNKVIAEIKKSNVSSLNTKYEVDLASLLLKIHPWAQMAKFARTGGEANSLAIRAAKAYNEKEKIIVCGYHGWHDWYLGAKFSSKYNNLETHLFENLKFKGVSKAFKNQVYSISYGDINSLREIIDSSNDISCFIMEVGRDYYPDKKFLLNVKSLCRKNKIVLIFDECTTGFREFYGGLHLRYGVNPDIAMFGKAIGNGYAITSIIGKKKIMKSFNETFVSSTFWSEKIGFVAGVATIKKMKRIKSWLRLKNKAKLIKSEIKKIAIKNKLTISFLGMDTLITFSIKGIKNTELNKFIADDMIKKNFLTGNRLYVSLSHSESLIKKYIKNMDIVFKKISSKIHG